MFGFPFVNSRYRLSFIHSYRQCERSPKSLVENLSLNLSTSLPLRILLLHPLLILRIPLRLRPAHIFNLATPTRTTGSLQELTALRVVVLGLFDCRLTVLLSGSPHCGAVDGIGSGLVGAVVGGCLAVGGAAAAAVDCGGEAEGGGAGVVVVGRHGGELGWVVVVELLFGLFKASEIELVEMKV